MDNKGQGIQMKKSETIPSDPKEYFSDFKRERRPY